MRCTLLALPMLLATACVTTPPALPAVTVAALRETDPVGTADVDAADDPAIWRNPTNPAASLIVGTDKRAGIHVYTLAGRSIGFAPLGEVNNVDLRDNVLLGDRRVILVGASNRNNLLHPRMSLLTLDGYSGALTPIADVAIDAPGEAYGFCMGRVGGDLRAYVVTKEGRVLELVLDLANATTPTARLNRSFSVATQPEGCVVDDRTGQLYLGEEDVGIWRFDLMTAIPVAIPFAMVGADDGLVADVEGLAIAPDGANGGMLVASSQGDNAYALFDLATGALRARFRINGGSIDGTYDTDGIELALGDFGPGLSGGLFVAQDGDNRPDAQNFKLLSWADIVAATGASNAQP
jgi:3-phytase